MRYSRQSRTNTLCSRSITRLGRCTSRPVRRLDKVAHSGSATLARRLVHGPRRRRAYCTALDCVQRSFRFWTALCYKTYICGRCLRCIAALRHLQRHLIVVQPTGCYCFPTKLTTHLLSPDSPHATSDGRFTELQQSCHEILAVVELVSEAITLDTLRR